MRPLSLGSLPTGASTRVLVEAAEWIAQWHPTRDALIEKYLLWKLVDKAGHGRESNHHLILQALQSAGLFSANELERLKLDRRPQPSEPVDDNDFFDADEEHSASDSDNAFDDDLDDQLES